MAGCAWGGTPCHGVVVETIYHLNLLSSGEVPMAQSWGTESAVFKRPSTKICIYTINGSQKPAQAESLR